MATLWGDVIRVPVERLRPLQGGERVGSFTVAYTPGHASHHVAFLHESGRAFVGDVAGVRVLPQTLIMAHAPPPDIDLEAWERSLDLIESWAPASLALPHFGVVDDVQDHLEHVRVRLAETAELARHRTEDEFVREAEQRFAPLPAPIDSIYRATAPPADSYAGLRRYWTKARDSQT
jgi:glyoxylase-like metal-dependent hydrolase (beta-lactamase superfamily II)